MSNTYLNQCIGFNQRQFIQKNRILEIRHSTSQRHFDVPTLRVDLCFSQIN